MSSYILGQLFLSIIRSNHGGRLRSSLRYHSNQNSSNGDERSSGTIGGGLSDIYFGNEEKLNPTLRNENRGKLYKTICFVITNKQFYT